MKMSSQLPVSICMTEFEVKPPYKPNCDVIEEISRDVTERVVL